MLPFLFTQEMIPFYSLFLSENIVLSTLWRYRYEDSPTGAKLNLDQILYMCVCVFVCTCVYIHIHIQQQLALVEILS